MKIVGVTACTAGIAHTYIVKEKLEQTISYNVSNEKKWYVRILPLFVKWLALGFIFRRNDRAHTMTLSNIGPITMDEEYREEIENFHLLIGVSKRQPAKCGVCAYEGKVNITFTWRTVSSGTLNRPGYRWDWRATGL